MRIIIDLQGAQASNAKRGIGRYSLSLGKAIARNRGEHEVLITLNGLFPDTIEPIRAAFEGLLPQENIRIWTAPNPVDEIFHSDKRRRAVAEYMREAFLASLRPDIVLVTSLFEGLVDDAVTSIGVFSRSVPTAVTLHDLIPLIHPRLYLENPVVKIRYLNKIDHLRRADLLLAISRSSSREAVDHLGFAENLIINASEDAEGHFKKLEISAEEESRLREKYGLDLPFVMYTGGIDHRKNIEGLIRAFALLQDNVRRTHQLAIICSLQHESRQALESLTREHGLREDEVILTDFVPENDLVALYNLCKLFVFPSWHEGFGLPILEAMRCGAPVVGSNASSIPEVIGRDDALFDPCSDESIAAKITEALTDDNFRTELIRHSGEQAKKFSWEESAKRAIAAFEKFHNERQKDSTAVQLSSRRPKLAYVSPLPPERSGIADYSAELLPELARHYDIEVIVDHSEVSDPWIKGCLPIRSVEWFGQHIHRYDRVVYHFGNSIFHEHMFQLLERFPGVVVLHDFFLSGIQAHREICNLAPGGWIRELYESHGYIAVQERFHMEDSRKVIFKYPCNFSVLQHAVGMIVHSAHSITLGRAWYGNWLTDDWAVIPLLRVPAIGIERKKMRDKLGLMPDDFVTCSFGLLGPTKQNHRLLRAWLKSNLAQDPRCRLIFVGENDSGEYGQKLIEIICQSGIVDRIRITGWVDAETFQHYLSAADIAVQLRTLSRGETSAASLDCMNFGLATIVNANGSNAELPPDSVWILPDEFEDAELVEAIETLWRNAERRNALGSQARKVIQTRHAPRACAEQYAKAIERFYAGAETGVQALVDVLGGLDNIPSDREFISTVAAAIANNHPLKRPAYQLLVDVSEMVQRDVKSGIQRATRSILKELLNNPPIGYRVEPIYATTECFGYRYARNFTLRFFNCPTNGFSDDLVEVQPGDIFLGLDLQPKVIPAQVDYLEFLRNRGVRIYFVVYDLLPIVLPKTFPKEGEIDFAGWLSAIVAFDGALCISQTVAGELANWLKINGKERLRPFKIGWFHLGADIENSMPTCGLPDDAPSIISQLVMRPSFLVVGTIEPRKGYEQILAAFEQLWADGLDANLVIVGKHGWMMDKLVENLRFHKERAKRLFWLEKISDEFLEKVYNASTCLIAASEGEGFGLPLIEAAQHKLPIIARNIPVFCEIASDHAFFFSGKEPHDLVTAIKNWLMLYKSGQHPKSEDMQWLTWKQSTQQLLGSILKG